MHTPTLTGITVYPMKGCRGIALERASLYGTGLALDREWMIVDREGTFVSQRTIPALARIRTALENALVLSAPDGSELRLPVAWDDGADREVVIHHNRTQATDCGDHAAEWVSRVLGGEYRIVRFDAWRNPRPTQSRVDTSPGTLFADAFPLLVASEPSLADLNARITARGGDPVHMDRFRANLVVSDCVPYAEDAWREFCINGTTFITERPCTRCSVTTVNQQTAERGTEPLATLATYRKTPDGVIFGMNASVLQPPTEPRLSLGPFDLAVGMPIEVLARV